MLRAYGKLLLVGLNARLMFRNLQRLAAQVKQVCVVTGHSFQLPVSASVHGFIGRGLADGFADVVGSLGISIERKDILQAVFPNIHSLEPGLRDNRQTALQDLFRDFFVGETYGMAADIRFCFPGLPAPGRFRRWSLWVSAEGGLAKITGRALGGIQREIAEVIPPGIGNLGIRCRDILNAGVILLMLNFDNTGHKEPPFGSVGAVFISIPCHKDSMMTKIC